MKTMLKILVLIFYMFSSTECVKVLVVFPMPSPSHNILGTALAKGLANGGMDVTYLSPFSIKDAPQNLRELKLDGLAEWFSNVLHKKEIDLFSLENQHPVNNILVLTNIGQQLVEKMFNHEVIQKLLKSSERFDAVIIQQFWTDAMKILGYHFKAPLIVFSVVASNRWVNGLVGNPEPPSYVPEFLMNFDVNNPSFLNRAHNLIFGIICQGILDFKFYPAQNDLLKKFYPDGPELSELQRNVSLVLVNSHDSINQAVPRVPNMIDIGGYHISPPKSLPTDLQKFMDNAKNGVIYFSMGSNLVPSTMPKATKEAILNVLGSRKEQVLWKWDEDILENKPENIKLSKWFPQQDILAHPNCKLFITHGGLLSTTETVYHGVPVLAFPIFGDQKANAARVESLGFGKFLSFSRINENRLKEIVDELLENPKYRENAKYRSRLMHDRPIAPMDLAIYWIKYVIRYKGAPHLRVAGADLPYVKYFMLDVFASIFAAIAVIIYVFIKIISICTRKNSKRKVKQN